MHTMIKANTFPTSIRGISDGSVAGTCFYDIHSGERLVPAGMSIQQEGMSEVRVRFAAAYGIASFVMCPDDTMLLNIDNHD